jgi:hypothetical protein
MARGPKCLLLAGALLFSPRAHAKSVEVEKKPDVLTVKRPAGGEWIGLYLQGKKAGWAFNQIDEAQVDGKTVVRAKSVVLLSATIGGAKTERKMSEERYYEDKDGGALLGFRIERSGDGGTETIVAKRKGDQMEIHIQRPQRASETRTLPASRETVEQADAPRLALLRKAKIVGQSLDDDDLADKGSMTEPSGDGDLVQAGVHVKVHKTTTIEEKDKMKVVSELDDDGKVVEVEFGQPPVMVGKAEPEAVAKQLEVVDLFALTRVVLDAAPPSTASALPGELLLHVTGLTADFQKVNNRQSYVTKPDGTVDVDIRVREPKTKAQLPVAGTTDEVKESLKPSLAVESADPAIQAQAKKIIGDEKDAWTASQKLLVWVYRNVHKAYGASSDRATDVLIRKEGDCTEHALLFTALARSVGIPARRVDGLVYMPTEDGVNAMYWHEWSEVWVGEWIQVDPTFNQPVADATHLMLGMEGHADSAALIGQLKIRVK